VALSIDVREKRALKSVNIAASTKKERDFPSIRLPGGDLILRLFIAVAVKAQDALQNMSTPVLYVHGCM
jgi:hypothetical protein